VNRQPLDPEIIETIRERYSQVRNNEKRKYKVELHLFWDAEEVEDGCPDFTVDQLREFANAHGRDLVRDLLPGNIQALNQAKKVSNIADVQVQDPDDFINDEEDDTENFAKLVFYVQTTLNRVQLEDFFGALDEEDLVGTWQIHDQMNIADLGEFECGFLNVSSISVDP
jgi:hypothetical protein